MNMNTQGIQAKIIACVGSVGVGFSFCCSHIDTPNSKGRTPMKISARMLPFSGAAQGNKPKRLKSDEVSGAERSVSQPKNGAWRNSMVTKITL